MNRLSAIWAAVVAGILSTFVLPATAWAAENDFDARRPRISFGSVFCLIPCLLFVGVIGLVIFLVIKNQQKKR